MLTGTNLWIFLGVLGFFQALVNVLLTRELGNHVPFLKERLPLLLVLWLLPLFGAWYTFRKIGTDFYQPEPTGNAAFSANVMGMGELFNPNAKTELVIEEKWKPQADDQHFPQG